MKEKCAHCHNMVVGQFTPSETRKWLTALAKKGGMKAVLAYAGSVIPGFGNVAGFIAGTALDVIYGNDINKLVNKVADAFGDNKIYVFTCPKCGHTWTHRESDEDTVDYNNLSSYYTTASSEPDENIEEAFNNRFDSFLEKLDDAVDNRDDAVSLASEMEMYARSLESTNPVISSQYYYLAGICMLLYIKQHYPDENTINDCLAGAYFLKANTIFDDSEYKLMLAAADTLNCATPEDCIKADSIETDYYAFDNETLFKQEWLKDIYNSCRYLSISHFDNLIKEDNNNYDDDELETLTKELWLTGYKLNNSEYHLISTVELFLSHINDYTSSGKMSVKCAKYLNEAYETEGHTLEGCDLENYGDLQWLLAYVYYASSIVEESNPKVHTDKAGGLQMLRKAANLSQCYPSIVACEKLGQYYERGEFVTCNLDEALSFYSREKELFKEDIDRVKSKIKSCYTSTKLTNSDSNEYSSAEAEYFEELSAILRNGEASTSERRLLDKLRIKLNISETRAAELEASLLNPQLNENEKEYLHLYRECVTDDGKISAGERRLLDRLRLKLEISEKRAYELENL